MSQWPGLLIAAASLNAHAPFIHRCCHNSKRYCYACNRAALLQACARSSKRPVVTDKTAVSTAADLPRLRLGSLGRQPGRQQVQQTPLENAAVQGLHGSNRLLWHLKLHQRNAPRLAGHPACVLGSTSQHACPVLCAMDAACCSRCVMPGDNREQGCAAQTEYTASVHPPQNQACCHLQEQPSIPAASCSRSRK